MNVDREYWQGIKSTVFCHKKFEGLDTHFDWMFMFACHSLLNLPDPSGYSTSNRNKCQKQKIVFLGSRASPIRWADNLTAICEPIV
jgi:hypothetical protein